MFKARRLTAAEKDLARTVYASTIPFDRVYLTNLELGSAVTLAGMDLSTGRFDYTINWTDGFGGIMTDAERRATLIHELCHVWQGENGIWPTFYMGQSLWSQLSSGVEDIWKKRKWRGWGTHRSTAYKFPRSAIGNPWTSFNVEQQASLVESWFMPERERIRPAGPGRVSSPTSAMACPAAIGRHGMRAFPISATSSVRGTGMPPIARSCCRAAATRRSRRCRIVWLRSAILRHAMPMASSDAAGARRWMPSRRSSAVTA